MNWRGLRRKGAQPMSRHEEPKAQNPLGAADEAGQTLVEMALSLTIFLSVLLGLIQICLALYAYTFVSEASREASRWAMVRGNTCNADLGSAFCSSTTGVSGTDVTNYVLSLGYPGLDASKVTVSTQWCSATSSGTPATTTWPTCGTTVAETPGNQVQVKVSYLFPLAIPNWKSTSLNLSSTSQMIITQ